MSGLNRKKPSSVEEWTADTWYREFFSTCSLPAEDAESYAVIFAQNGMQWDMLQIITKELLKEMKIYKVGHIIAILRAAEKLSSEEQRSEITHNPNTTIPSKVVNLKSVVKLKNSQTRQPSEVGGAKRDCLGMKRSLPEEGPTLSVKMPSRIRTNLQTNVPDESSTPVKTAGKEDSMEVSSSTEKKQKKSVFERLGSSNGSRQALLSAQNQPSPIGILKKNSVSNSCKGPLKFPVNTSGMTLDEPRRCHSPSSLALRESPERSRSPIKATPAGVQSPFRSTTQEPAAVKSEPSFHVTVNRLSNPLVTKVPNGPPSKRPLEGCSSVVTIPSRTSPITLANRNSTSTVPNRNSTNTIPYRNSNNTVPYRNINNSTPNRNINNSTPNRNINSTPNRNINNSTPNRNYNIASQFSRTNNNVSSSEKPFYGSMAADHIEMSKGLGMDKDMKQRLGNRPYYVNKLESAEEKKRVSFGYVKTKEIPALPGTQPVNQSPNTGSLVLSERFYTGSVAFGTARRINSNRDFRRKNN